MYGLNNGIPVSLKSIPSFGIAPQNQLTAAIQSLFWDGSQGWWYDDDDTSTLFQDSAGTTPVTAVEQFVGLQLDKSKGLVLGPELVTNGDFSQGTTGWTATTVGVDFSGGVLTFNRTSGNPDPVATNTGSATSGKTYVFTFDVVSISAGTNNVGIRVGAGSVFYHGTGLVSTGRKQIIFSAATTGQIQIYSGGAATLTTIIDNISVRELPGNHRYAPASGNRPVWSKRVNLLTRTEQTNTSPWNFVNVSGTATQTGNNYTFGANASDRILQSAAAAVAGVSYRAAVELSGSGSVRFLAFDGVGSALVSTNINLSPIRTRYELTFTSVGSGSSGGVGVYNNVSGTSGASFTFHTADFRPANQATGTIPLYQRVNTSSDYDTNGFPGYLRADGIDDFLQTNSIDFTATDKVTLCAGLRKLSDAALGVATELSAATASNNGAFALEAPAGASPSFNFASKGTTLANNTAQQFIAPITQTVTGIGDIAAARNTIRIGGVEAGVNTATQGTGNYGNFPVYFFRRGGTANPFNGYEYSNIAVGKLLTASQLASLEQYTYSKTINPDGAIYATQAGFSWNSATNPPNSTTYTGSRFITPTHEGMRRCLLLDNGTVNYYLDPNDSTKKLDGTAATLTGADGQVMVEIPAFYTKRTVVGTTTTWEISSVPATGFTLHPAFTKDGVDVAFRYYGAYDACVYDDSASAYISGLNWDNNVSPNGVAVDTAADKLASVSGVYPMVGLTRAEFRTLAANRGSGWRQVDWTLWSAVQLLYLIEYQTFFSQNVLGAGNTNGGYLTASGDQNQSPHTIAGASNSLGNTSTNTTTGAGVNARPGTSFMCYRGIENFYGNAWNWADGVIVNPDGTASAGQGDWWFTNNSADFSDTVRTNMTQITNGAATANGFVSAIASSDNFFVGTSTSGGSSTTFLTDQLFASTAADRVVRVGGGASDGAAAGAFCVAAAAAASDRNRSVGARLAF